jgi:hypothetical protein
MPLDRRRKHRMPSHWWLAWLLAMVALAGCGAATVAGAQKTCLGEGSGFCEGDYDTINGRHPERIETGSGDAAVDVHGEVSVLQGTVEVSFASLDGLTTSAEATPRHPAVLSGLADVTGDGFDVTFESIEGEARGVSYKISYQPPPPAFADPSESSGSSEQARREGAGHVMIFAELQGDGALRIREHREFVYIGAFRGATYDLPLDAGQQATLNEITDDHGRTYREGSCASDGDKVPGTYQVDDVGRFTVTWCWDPPPTYTTRRIVLDYTVTNATVPAGDSSELDWQFVGDGWNVPATSVNIELGLPSEARVLDHAPADATVDDTNPGSVRLHVDDLPPATPVALRVELPGNVPPEPVIDGWQGVRNSKRPIAYDVPPDWIALSPDVHVGFEEPDPDASFGYAPRVIMSGAAEYGRRRCGGDSWPRARVGTSGMGEVVDTAKGAKVMAIEWAEAAYDSDDGDDAQLDVGDPEPFEAHGLRGHLVRVDVVPGPDDCAPEHAHVRVASVHVPSEDDVYNLILYAPTSGDDVVDARTIDTIFSSLRLHQEE